MITLSPYPQLTFRIELDIDQKEVKEKIEACLCSGLAGQFQRKDMKMQVGVCAVHSRVEGLGRTPPLRRRGVRNPRYSSHEGGCPPPRRGAHLGSQITNIPICLFWKRSGDPTSSVSR